jgi:two-component system chemotaxis response regulator CheY
MKKVLIADDSKSIRKMIRMTLESDIFDVFEIDKDHIYEANDGLEAFGILGKYPDIDYFFSDVNMPHLNGDELIEVLNDTGKINDVKVFFVTTENMDGRIDPTVRHCVLGTIQKPLKPEKIVDTVRMLITKRSEEELAKKVNIEELSKQVAKQKQLLFEVVSKYYELQKIAEPYNPDRMKEIIGLYISEEDDLPENELIATAPAILSEYFFENNINNKVDSSKIQFLFSNYMMDDEKEENNSKDEFVINLMAYDDRNSSMTKDKVDYETMIKNIDPMERIFSTYEPKDIVKFRFEEIIKYIKSKQKAIGTDKTLNYDRMKFFMYEAKKMLIDVDFTVDIKELRFIENIITKLLDDIEYLQNFKKKTTSEDMFLEVFSQYQNDYLAYRHVQDYLDVNKDKDKTYRKRLMKLDKALNIYQATNTKLFFKLFSQQLQKVIVTFKNLVDRYTYLYDRLLWERARESLSIKEYFRTKGIAGDMSTKSLLNYYLKINNGKLDQTVSKPLNDLVNMLDNGFGRDVVYLSTNLKEGSKIEEMVKKIEPNWKFYTLAKLSLIDSWVISNGQPDILIIDYNFDMEVQNGIELATHVFNKYDKLSALKSVMMIFDKVNIELIEEAAKVGIKEHVKRPLVPFEFTNKLRFL